MFEVEYHPDLNPPPPDVDYPGEAYQRALAAVPRAQIAAAFALAAAATPTALAGALMMLRSRMPGALYMSLLVVGLSGLAGAAWLLRTAGLPHPEWRRGTLHTIVLAALSLYFVPFYDWWIRFPSSLYLAGNMLAMAVTVFLLLNRLNKAVSMLGEALEDETLRLEGLAGLWISVLTGSIFILWTLVALSMYYAQYGSDIFPFFLLRDWGVAMLLPFALTSAVLLKAARRSWQRFGKPVEAPAPP